MRPDKKTITDEVWDDARVRSFLLPRAPQGGDDPDFVLLLNAYRGMRAEDFARFVNFYCKEGHDPNPRNEAGVDFIRYISTHRHAAAFIDILVHAGAERR
jgi:hypothetical protein